MTMSRGEEAEEFVAALFGCLGYRVQEEQMIAGVTVDLVIEFGDKKSPVEVKRYGRRATLRELTDVAARLQSVVEASQHIAPLIVVVGDVSVSAKQWIEHEFDLKVWDADILRAKAKPFPELMERLSRLLMSGVKTRDAVSARRSEQKEADKLAERLRTHENKNDLTPREYEELCREVAAFLFDPHLYGFEGQAQTTDGGNRFDFICRIKPGNPFWDGLRADFRTRSVLFECKNYKDRITADQVYSTERYLFSSALRTVCVLISRKGPDAGCERAAQGALREAGKLILLLSNADLIEMLKLKAEGEDCTTYLDEKIWKFISTLPR